MEESDLPFERLEAAQAIHGEQALPDESAALAAASHDARRAALAQAIESAVIPRLVQARKANALAQRKVTDAMPSKIRNRLGLESGDRVLTVNGQNVGSNPAGDADLLGQVKQSGEAVIEVQRGEQTITIRQQF